MRLHENRDLFREAVIATSQQKGIREIFVEKDYWVTVALHHIFTGDIGNHAVFKGGTALSKCFGLIHRFSEDIDMVVIRTGGETSNQLKNKIKRISDDVSKVLPEIPVDGLTNKVGMIRKTAHRYPQLFNGHFGSIREIIVLESTWLGHFEPYVKAPVSSFIFEMMSINNQSGLIAEYGLNPFEVLVLGPERTFCEKIMSLVRFSQTPNPMTDLRNKIRHVYDLHMMLKNSTINDFFLSGDFDLMLLQVASDDFRGYKSNNKWLQNHPSSTLIFSDTVRVWGQLREAYVRTFGALVIGELPPEEAVKETLLLVAKRLRSIEWNLKAGEIQ